MRAGLYPLSVIARFLGQRPSEMTRYIEMDALPAIKVATATRPAWRVALPTFHRWLAARSSGLTLTVEELREELRLCEEAEKPKKGKEQSEHE